ncbi:MAG: N-formylglutamate amidohydrolase [Pseudomonadota bacterium]
MDSSIAPALDRAPLSAQTLRSPKDPPLLDIVNPGSTAPFFLVADHAGRCVPESLGRLGLGSAPFDRHIAYDIGVDALTRALAQRLGAPAIIHQYSRLLIDPNRGIDDPTSICAISDGVIVPGNRGLSHADAQARADAFFHPYHQLIEEWIDGFMERGVTPAMIAVHSFTPQFKGFDRPWQVGILWGDEGRLSVPVINRLAQDPDLCVGDNEPYTGKNRHGYTVETHAYPRNLPNTLIEVRQDLIDDADGVEEWADRLADCFSALLPTVGCGVASANDTNNNRVNS